MPELREQDRCEQCRVRRHSWFTRGGRYLCNECAEPVFQAEREEDLAQMIEQMRKALMEAHHDDWDMETVAEAAHICARVAIPEAKPRPSRQGGDPNADA